MRVLVVLSLSLTTLACSTSTGGGGGGFYFGADTKNCDGASGAGCSGLDGKSSGDGSASDGSASDDSAAGDDGAAGDSADDSAAADDGVLADASADDAGATGDDINAPDGFFDDPDTSTGKPDTGLPSDPNCNERAKIVYLVTEENKLLSFTPDTLKLQVVGTLNCPVSGTPFSMSVDRQANAWVLYQGGAFTVSGKGLFQVSTLDATCQATAYKPNTKGLELFGMGFSANSFGSSDETLYVAGGAAGSFQTTKNLLGSIAFPSMAVTNLATIDIVGGADLTGNGKGELFGFFPDSTPPAVRQIDKATGVATGGQAWTLPSNIFSGTQAWAFAQWGGNFYLFFKSYSDASTNVWKLDTATGQTTKVMSSIGYTVTGAGVSSCAPTSAPTP